VIKEVNKGGHCRSYTSHP